MSYLVTLAIGGVVYLSTELESAGLGMCYGTGVEIIIMSDSVLVILPIMISIEIAFAVNTVLDFFSARAGIYYNIALASRAEISKINALGLHKIVALYLMIVMYFFVSSCLVSAKRTVINILYTVGTAFASSHKNVLAYVVSMFVLYGFDSGSAVGHCNLYSIITVVAVLVDILVLFPACHITVFVIIIIFRSITSINISFAENILRFMICIYLSCGKNCNSLFFVKSNIFVILSLLGSHRSVSRILYCYHILSDRSKAIFAVFLTCYDLKVRAVFIFDHIRLIGKLFLCDSVFLIAAENIFRYGFAVDNNFCYMVRVAELILYGSDSSFIFKAAVHTDISVYLIFYAVDLFVPPIARESILIGYILMPIISAGAGVNADLSGSALVTVIGKINCFYLICIMSPLFVFFRSSAFFTCIIYNITVLAGAGFAHELKCAVVVMIGHVVVVVEIKYKLFTVNNIIMIYYTNFTVLVLHTVLGSFIDYKIASLIGTNICPSAVNLTSCKSVKIQIFCLTAAQTTGNIYRMIFACAVFAEIKLCTLCIMTVFISCEAFFAVLAGTYYNYTLFASGRAFPKRYCDIILMSHPYAFHITFIEQLIARKDRYCSACYDLAGIICSDHAVFIYNSKIALPAEQGILISVFCFLGSSIETAFKAIIIYVITCHTAGYINIMIIANRAFGEYEIHFLYIMVILIIGSFPSAVCAFLCNYESFLTFGSALGKLICDFNNMVHSVAHALDLSKDLFTVANRDFSGYLKLAIFIFFAVYLFFDNIEIASAAISSAV